MFAHLTLLAGFVISLAMSVDQNGVQAPIISPPPNSVLKPPLQGHDNPVQPASATGNSDNEIIGDDNSVLEPKLTPPSEKPEKPARGEEPPRHGKIKPADLLAGLAEAPLKVDGEKTTLLKVLRQTAPDRKQQERAVIAYWQLSGAVLDLTVIERSSELLLSKFPKSAHKAEFLAAQAAHRALADQAKQRLVKAQFDLAEAVGQPMNDPLPLPQDLPHAKNYETKLKELFRPGSVPAKLILLDKRIDVLRTLLVDRCAAVVAADDVLSECLSESGVELTAAALISACEGSMQQRRAFIEAVREYNSDIAEFALTVAPAGASPERLEGLLILKGPASSDEHAAPAQPKSPIFASKTSPRVALRLTGFEAPSKTPSTSLFQGLATLPPLIQSQKLGQYLHQSYAGAEPTSSRTLAECLQSVQVGARGSLLESFWYGNEAAAQTNVLAATLEQLESLELFLRDQPTNPDRAKDMLLVRSARLALKSDIDEAKLRLLNEQYSLGVLLGVNLESNWILPGSSPHTGRYEIAESASKSSLARAKQEAAITLLHDELTSWSAAVVRADLLRAELRQAAEDRPATLNLVAELDAIARQRHLAMNFLRTAREYNVAISKFVMAIAPADISAQQLADVWDLHSREK